MATDKFSATWCSHTSISDFTKCHRAYYLKNVYKDPKTGHKVQLMSPALALGQVVHEVLESLSNIPTDKRFSDSLVQKFQKSWQKISGKRGGFSSIEQEEKYKARGEAMMRRVMNHPGPLTKLAVKIQQDLPHFWLSEEDNIILCGKIDWLEYLPETDSVNIIDFKTSKNQEDGNSLQLPIYHLLVHHCQKRKVEKASYWYLEMSDELIEKTLPDLEEARSQILLIAKKMKLARQLQVFKCVSPEGCMHCRSMEKILSGEAELVGVNDFNQDIYILPTQSSIPDAASILL